MRAWEEHLKVNLTSAFLCSLKVLPSMLTREAGCIINVPSVHGRQGGARLAALCASMHGLIGFTRALSEEYNEKGIRVNAVCPAHVDSSMTRNIAEDISQNTKYSTEEILTEMQLQNHSGAFLHPEIVADVILRLASQEGNSITGQVFEVDGPLETLG